MYLKETLHLRAGAKSNILIALWFFSVCFCTFVKRTSFQQCVCLNHLLTSSGISFMFLVHYLIFLEGLHSHVLHADH